MEWERSDEPNMPPIFVNYLILGPRIMSQHKIKKKKKKRERLKLVIGIIVKK